MSEEPKKLDNSSKQLERDENGRLLPGQKSLNPTGRPEGSLSFTTEIKKYLRKNPDKFYEILHYYVDNKKMRDLLWKMIDGQPKQNLGFGDDEDGKYEVDIKIRKNEDKS